MKNKVDLIRKQFPIFNSKENPLIYFDNASTSQKPDCVIDLLTKFYSEYNANVHRGIYKIADIATLEYEKVRIKVKDFINSYSEKSIVFTKGTTESINLVAHSWGDANLNKGDEILITEMEHHSNIVPWQIIAKKTGSILKYIPIKDGKLNLDNIDSLINNKTKIVSIIHQSNVLGVINPIKEIIKKSHQVGAKVLVDAAQSIPHMVIDVQELNCDFLTFSGHKMCGPTGVGVLFARENILEKMDPLFGGGQMIETVELDKSTWNEIPFKFEAGTPNIAQVIGLGAAIDYIQNIGFDFIKNHISELVEYATSELKKINNIQIYGPDENQGSVISFNIKNHSAYDLVKLLDCYNIAVRAGHHCVQPLMRYYNISSSIRKSFYFYNTKSEIEYFMSSLKKSIDVINN